jgi:hypothetical protein
MSVVNNMEPEEAVSGISVAKRSCEKNNGNSKSRRLYTFDEARKVARGHGFDSKQEFLEYTCPGAYQIPKDADVVWKEDWRGWDDFLGIPLSFQEVSYYGVIIIVIGVSLIWFISFVP